MRVTPGSRIVAAAVDEPYKYAINAAFGEPGSEQNPCDNGPREQVIQQTSQRLAAGAAALKRISPLTRFWVNFTRFEIEWMQNADCLHLDTTNIDVISLDIYETQFNPSIAAYYDWILAHKAPEQQVALIPGTFSGHANAQTQAGLLSGFFSYAQAHNSTCNQPLGKRGVTGNFDRCPVWLVAGWLAGNSGDYLGLFHSSSAPIANVWRQKVAEPIRPDLAKQLSRGKIVNPVLERQLLNE